MHILFGAIFAELTKVSDMSQSLQMTSPIITFS